MPPISDTTSSTPSGKDTGEGEAGGADNKNVKHTDIEARLGALLAATKAEMAAERERNKAEMAAERERNKAEIEAHMEEMLMEMKAKSNVLKIKMEWLKDRVDAW